MHYCIKVNKYRKPKNSKTSQIFNKLFLFIIFDKRSNKDKKNQILKVLGLTKIIKAYLPKKQINNL